ncbi:hypothetical protein [Flagellimonas sp. GZD32]|uniref:hypothetical protein n=1 Tax=Flagellimonas cixiensis TaxID=3228750 RepID=UPI0035C8DBCE
MIKFFRKIRQQLLSEGKTGKYLKYAIGEIVLVMIGILLALQVNNWNTKQAESSASKNLMNRLLIESYNNKKAISENIFEIKSLMSDAEHFLQLMGEDFTDKNQQTVDSLIYSILTSPNLSHKSSTLNEALSSGEVSLIASDSLRDYLYQIPSIYANIQQTEDIENNDGSNNFVPYLYNNISLRQVDYRFAPIKDRIGKSKLVPQDNRIILKDRKFESMVDNKFFLLNNMLIKNQEYETLNNKVIQLLEKETQEYE